VTKVRLRPRRDDPSKGRLGIRGVLADAGWEDANPHQSGVQLGLLPAAEPPLCCTVGQQFWMAPRRTQFNFWDMRRAICPPVGDMRINVRGPGRAAFKLTAPKVDLSNGMAADMALEVIIGNHCSIGGLPFDALRRKGRTLVYP